VCVAVNDLFKQGRLQVYLDFFMQLNSSKSEVLDIYKIITEIGKKYAHY